MKKKLLVLPMKNQYEQLCNATALQKMGVPIIKSLKKKSLGTVQEWITNDAIVTVEYPNQTEQIIDIILSDYL